MSLQNTPNSIRPHIAFFGCTNAGKSSLVNAITNQELSIVSSKKGTTTDPVKKTMEILPLGPVVIIDTAGLDDETELAQKRIEKTNEILNKTNIAILVVDGSIGLNSKDKELILKLEEKKLPYLIVYNKSDLIQEKKELKENEIYVSAVNNFNIDELKEKIAKFTLQNKEEKFIIKDKLNRNDIVVLVIPIDESAPKGRLILPQHMTIREVLDANAICVCSQVEELENTLNSLSKKPKVVITDSQAYSTVKNIVPDDIMLTSFSILMANFKGDLKTLIEGAKKISELKDNDKILIAEGCTHHRQCNDIGTVKFPKWLKEFTKKDLHFEFCSGDSFKKDLNQYALIIHCGACMLNEAEMKSRINFAKDSSTKIVNYGIAIAYMNGILKRTLEFLPEAYKMIDG